jgi:hypothetical protein
MDNRDWLGEVQRQLAHTSKGLREQQRGAFTLCPPDVHVLFGNEGEDEVLLLRSLLPELGATILAYDEMSGRPCWAMIVRSRLNAPGLSEIVWTAREAARAAAPAPSRLRAPGSSRRISRAMRTSMN